MKLPRSTTLLLAGLLGACASREAPAPPASMQTPATQPARVVTLYIPTPVPLPSADNVTPLDYYEWARAANAEELLAERARLSSRLQAAAPADEAVIDTVHLGILMSVSAIASRESETEAKALLSALDTASFDADSHDYLVFADLLLNHLEQREKVGELTRHLVTSREELEKLERNNAQLQQKIDALTRIEEQLIEREQAQGDQ